MAMAIGRTIDKFQILSDKEQLNQITIVMYHYVRPIQGSKYPRVKGLELDSFKRQLDYLSLNYNFVTASDVLLAIKGKKNLLPNSCWLTFDDGYKDHVLYVMPELLKRGIQGAFFPPVAPVVNKVMLDVNSIHFILASERGRDKSILVQDLNALYSESGASEESIEANWKKYSISSRYDTDEVMYIKNMLQYVLPKGLRSEIVSILFNRYVGISQSDFANDLYLSCTDVQNLINEGMYVGSHGFSHLWMNHEDFASQEMEISKSTEFLSSVGADVAEWIMCYPYGAYNNDTIDLISKRGCVAALTTEVGTARLSKEFAFKLPRFDTNDFPQ